jgi:hypothetical protein
VLGVLKAPRVGSLAEADAMLVSGKFESSLVPAPSLSFDQELALLMGNPAGAEKIGDVRKPHEGERFRVLTRRV